MFSPRVTEAIFGDRSMQKALAPRRLAFLSAHSAAADVDIAGSLTIQISFLRWRVLHSHRVDGSSFATIRRYNYLPLCHKSSNVRLECE